MPASPFAGKSCEILAPGSAFLGVRTELPTVHPAKAEKICPSAEERQTWSPGCHNHAPPANPEGKVPSHPFSVRSNRIYQRTTAHRHLVQHPPVSVRKYPERSRIIRSGKGETTFNSSKSSTALAYCKRVIRRIGARGVSTSHSLDGLLKSCFRSRTSCSLSGSGIGSFSSMAFLRNQSPANHLKKLFILADVTPLGIGQQIEPYLSPFH